MTETRPLAAVEVIEANPAAYNARDDGFMRWFADEVEVEVMDQKAGAVVMRGLTEVRRFYAVLYGNEEGAVGAPLERARNSPLRSEFVELPSPEVTFSRTRSKGNSGDCRRLHATIASPRVPNPTTTLGRSGHEASEREPPQTAPKEHQQRQSDPGRGNRAPAHVEPSSNPGRGDPGYGRLWAYGSRRGKRGPTGTRPRHSAPSSMP